MLQVSQVANVAAYLPEIARQRPYQPAVVHPHGRDRYGRESYTQFTFQQLDAESDALARGLDRVGIRAGVRTVLMVPPSLEFFALTFALFKVGAVPVLVDPGMGLVNLKKCLVEAQPEAFVGVTKAHLARQVFGWGKSTIRTLVTVGQRLGWGGYTYEKVRELGGSFGSSPMAEAPDAMAAILFTSGSTGPPKGAIYTHAIFLHQVEILRTVFGIEPGEIDLTTFPLFALFAPALGMTAIIPDMDATRPAQVDPVKIIEAVSSFGVTNLFGSPALLHRVGTYGEQHNVQLPSLRRVISAGAPVPAAVVERFAGMLAPGAEVHTPYGATEALPVSSIGSQEILGETRKLTAQGAGICVGRPMPGVEVRIIRITDDVIAEWSDDLLVEQGQVGEVVVQGPIVTRSYYHRKESTRLAKIPDRTGGFFHRMGDVGYFDGQGRLWMCGRKSQHVQTNSGTLFTVMCEGVFNTHPSVYRTALVGVPRNGVSEPVLCVELKPDCRQASQVRIREELLDLAASQACTRSVRTILFHPAFPVDTRHNSKIFREKLARWAARQLR